MATREEIIGSISALAQTVELSMSELQSQISEAKVELAAAKLALDAANAEVGRLNTENSDLVAAYNALEARLKELQALYDDLTNGGPPAPPISPFAAVGSTWTEDMTRDYYNGGLKLPWPKDFSWAKGPFGAGMKVIDDNTAGEVRVDVTEAVKATGRLDLFIRRVGGTNFTFHSRQAADPAVRPYFIVDGQRFEVTADSSFTPSTVKTMGGGATLSTATGFLVKAGTPVRAITKAELVLNSPGTGEYGNQTLTVYAVDIKPDLPTSPALPGTAADIVWRIPEPDRRQYVIPVGDDEIVGGRVYQIPKAHRRETMFSRIIMEIHDDFDPLVGGKLPGLANTGQADFGTRIAGGGSEVANGVQWSARTNRRPHATDNPFGEDFMGFSPYAYRVDRETFNGEGPACRLPMPRKRRFVLDQMVKLNTINADGTANDDGELAYWIDGVCVLHWIGVTWRARVGDDTLPSEYWLDVYVGGTGYAAPHEHHITVYDAYVSTALLPA